MRFTVLKPVDLGAGIHKPGEVVECAAHNLDSLVNQRYLRAFDDTPEKLAALQAQVDQLRDRVNTLEARGKGGNR